MEGTKRPLRRVPQMVPLHTQRGTYHDRISHKAGDNRAELTAAQCRETEAVMADLEWWREEPSSGADYGADDGAANLDT